MPETPRFSAGQVDDPLLRVTVGLHQRAPCHELQRGAQLGGLVIEQLEHPRRLFAVEQRHEDVRTLGILDPSAPRGLAGAIENVARTLAERRELHARSLLPGSARPTIIVVAGAATHQGCVGFCPQRWAPTCDCSATGTSPSSGWVRQHRCSAMG